MNVLKVFILLCFGNLCVSCQFFNTEKISSETFYEEELETIDWNEVDTYPAFVECESYTEKSDQKMCFQEIVHQKIKAQLLNNNWVTSERIKDTALVVIDITNKGEMLLRPVQMGSLTLLQVPKIDSLIKKGIQELPNPSPAYKRGIPVKTTVIFPIVLNSQEL